MKERERSPYMSPNLSQDSPRGEEANWAEAMGRQLRLARMEEGRERGWVQYHRVWSSRSASERGWALG